jgi:hypothetical protein
MQQPVPDPANIRFIIKCDDALEQSVSVWEFEVSKGLVLALPDLEGLYFLNQSAGFIWAGMRSGSSPAEIASQLAVAFDIPHDVALRDVTGALAEWQRLFFAHNRAHARGSGSNYRLNGKHFHLLLDSQELEEEILPRLSHLAVPPDSSPGLTADFNLRRSADDSVSSARALLLQEMVRLSRGTGEWLALLHAGACATSRGCVVFPAASGSGKTTLAAVLMRSGFSFHADDSVGLEQGTLLIPPMPFALAIREGSWPVVGPRCPGFEEIGPVTRFGQQVRFLPPATQVGAVPAVALVFPSYDPASKTAVTPLEPLEALIALKEAGFWVQHTQASIQAFLDWMQALPRYRIVYSDVDEAVELFRGLLTS